MGSGPHQGDVGLETSSFNEDLSKIDGVENISGGGAPKPPVMPRISQKNFANELSDDDEDVKELSVVESDNSDPDGVDTPAVYMKKRAAQHQNNVAITSNHSKLADKLCFFITN